jgi:hypothetical protein
MAASAGTPSLARMVRETGGVMLDRSRTVLRELAVEELEETKRRTQRGLDVNYQRFAGYAPSTARVKGREHPATLFESGAMQNDLFVESTRRGTARIRFRSREQERKGLWHHLGTRKMRARKWLGVGLRRSRRIKEKFDTRMHLTARFDRRTVTRLEFGAR